MELKVKHIFITAVFCLFSLSAFSQFSEHPPEPMATTTEDWRNCAEDGTDPNPSVPPGLCLPIDDYIIPLLVVGLIFGVYRIHKINNPQTS